MDYYYDQLLSRLGFRMCFFIILGGILLLSLIILINKLWKRRTVLGAREETAAAAPPDLVSSADHTPSSSTNVQSYEVFLSFRGPDTRTNFTDHLYTSLMDAGIHTFRDDNEMRMGEEIKTELLTAIQQSRISIPVFSTNYADSKWCLIELTKMMECRQKLNQIVLPIFYDVEPSDVRYQRGTYAKAFKKHQKRVDEKTMEEWREALEVAGSLKGHNVKNRYETELIKSVVTMVLSELKKTSLVTTDYLVGIPHHVKEMLKLLDASSMEVRTVGIYGMGGIGKTTIAKAVYNKISCQFENCCFLEDVRETYQQHKGLVQLQKQLIRSILKLKDVDITSVDEGVNIIKERCRNKKVLIVLDDVDNLNLLRALANKSDWFGFGSRIIITTRDKDILRKDVAEEVYIPDELSPHQSLKLFSMHAFRRDRPLDEYFDLSSAIVDTAGGLPLALEVLGSHLSGKGKAVWEDALRKLTKIPHQEVQKKLRISYEELDHGQKQIFLDIACFFVNMNKRIASYFWKECFPHHEIDILLLRSLIKIGGNDKLRMHKQLRDLGREIVRSEHFHEPGERSRLWFHDDAWEVLMTHTGTRKVRGLRLDFGNGLDENCRDKEFAEMTKLGNGSEENFLTNEEFVGMSRLRLLQIDCAILAGDFKHLLSELRWLSWKVRPHNFLATNFHPEKLIVLDLSRSKVTEYWEGWNQIKMAKKLECINLSGCSDLIKTPDFSSVPSLEELILENCWNLVEIDASIGYLKCLVFLNMKNCRSLVDLPVSICGLNSLESLIVRGCIKLNRLPTGLKSLKALRELNIDGTSIEQLPDFLDLPEKLEILSARNNQIFTVLPTSIAHLRFLTNLALDKTQIVMLPDSIGSLSKLRCLSLCHCRSLKTIPDSIGQLESLVSLDLYHTGVTEIPDSIGNLKSLITFCLDRTEIIELPNSVGLLVKLEKLSIRYCTALRKIPDSFGKFESLVELDLYRAWYMERPNWTGHYEHVGKEIKLIGTQIVVLPDSIGSLLKLRKLSLGICRSARKIPDSIGQLKSLVYLQLYGAGVTEIPDWIGSLSMLKALLLRGCGSLRRIPISIGKLESLRELDLTGTGIVEIPDAIGELKSLAALQLCYTKIIALPDSIGSLSMLQVLSLRVCGSLRRIPDSIGKLESLRDLDLSGTGIIEIPDAIGELKSLKHLHLDDTQIIDLPDSIGSLSMLRNLTLIKCGSLRRIPDSIGRLELLYLLDLSRSGIIEIPDAIGELKSLEILYLDGTQIIELPESIGSLSKLSTFSLNDCDSLTRIPDTVGHLISLRVLVLNGTQITELPDTVGLLTSLTMLRLDGTQITKLPDSIWSLPKLGELTLMHCRLLRKIPYSIGRLKSLTDLNLDTTGIMDIPSAMGNDGNPKDLRTDMSGIDGRDCFRAGREIPIDIEKLLPHSLTRLTLESENSFFLPESISSLPKLYFLTIRNCRNHPSLPHLPSTLSQLHISRCAMETSSKFSNLTNLRTLTISDCENLLEANGIPSFKLVRLSISNCKKLHSFPHLPSCLKHLSLSSCMSVESFPDLSSCTLVESLQLIDFFKQTEIPGLERMKSLKSLNLSGCRSIERLPNMSIMEELETLILGNCEKLCDIEGLERLENLCNLDVSGCISVESIKQTEIQGLERMKFLQSLNLSGCRSIERLPDMSIMENLDILILSNCEKLCDIEGLERLEYLKILDVSECISLERLPNFSNFRRLGELRISNCKQLIKIQGINKGVHIYGRTTISGNVKIKRATDVKHLKNEKFTEDRGIKKRLRLSSPETHGSIKRLRSLETLHK